MRVRRKGALRALVAVLALCIGGVGGTGAFIVATEPGARGSMPIASGASPEPPGRAAEPQRTSAGSRTQVAPLDHLVPPTLMVVASESLSKRLLRRVGDMAAVQEVTTFDAAQVRLRGRRVNMLGISPSAFRAWTPPPTASSSEFWKALARGELAVSFRGKQALNVRLGRSYVVGGKQTRRLRLGATGKLGLEGVDVLVNREVGQSIGLVPDLGMLINAPGADLGKLKGSLRKLLGEEAQILRLRRQVAGGSGSRGSPSGGSGSRGSDSGGSDSGGKPRTYKQLYQRAAGRCPGLSWTVLAAIGQVESAHGRNVGPSSAGALGPMQFMPSTWRSYGIDGDRDGRADIMNPYDAVPSAARYLCANGAGEKPGSLRDAVYAYNHAWWYVREVLALAQRYA